MKSFWGEIAFVVVGAAFVVGVIIAGLELSEHVRKGYFVDKVEEQVQYYTICQEYKQGFECATRPHKFKEKQTPSV